jgi:hypothetical protein
LQGIHRIALDESVEGEKAGVRQVLAVFLLNQSG